MNEPDNFLERWSKRKRAAVEPPPPERAELAPQDDDKVDDKVDEKNKTAAQGDTSAAPTKDKPFDPASLPSIESIGADTDVTAFLRPGVPPELTRAALRRAWSSDPAIRDFVGLVENGWDFNDPQAMAGFGPISPAEVARLVTHMIGALPEPVAEPPGEAPKNPALGAAPDQEAAPAPPSPPSPPPLPVAKQPDASPDPADVQRNVKNGAVQKASGS